MMWGSWPRHKQPRHPWQKDIVPFRIQSKKYEELSPAKERDGEKGSD
jgi:hypothetical protein